MHNLKDKDKTDAGSFKTEDYINKQDYYNWTGLLSGFEIYTKAYTNDAAPDVPAADPDNLAAYNASKRKFTFYLSIWNALERNEKFVLYDLAKDNLVNYRNKEALYSLYCKGLVVQHDMPELVNEEFSTFVLNELNEGDVKLEKSQNSSGSAWNTFRIPFLMILLAVLLFVFITQQETFNKLMAGLVAFAGSIPILLKLLSSAQEKKPA